MKKNEVSGFLKTWKDDRGFGFIKPDDGSGDIFIHITELRGASRRPNRGDTIIYQVGQSEDGRPKAVNARIQGLESHSLTKLWFWIMSMFLGLLGAAAYFIHVLIN